MPIKEDKIHKIYYSTSELAQVIKVSLQEIYERDKEFGIVPKRSSTNYRRYSVKDVQKHVKIEYLLKVEGYTHKGAISNVKMNGWGLKKK